MGSSSTSAVLGGDWIVGCLIDEGNEHQCTLLLAMAAGEHFKLCRVQGWVWPFPICPHLPVEYGRVNLEVLELSGMRSSLKGNE